MRHDPTYTNVGIAWRAGARGAADALMVGATSGYFHSGTWALPTADAIPIIWGLRRLDLQQAGSMPACPPYIIGPNEPDRLDQAALSPVETAAWYVTMSHACPESHLVWWNGIDPRHLAASLDAIERDGIRPALPLGVHLYSVWPRQDARERIDALCHVLEVRGYDCLLWVTEVGVCGEWPGAYYIAQEWLRQMGEDARVEKIFWYTNSSGGYPAPCTYDLVQDGRLTIVGRAIADAQRGHFPARPEDDENNYE